jgi:integrase
MPRQPSIWWRKSHEAWFTTYRGEQINLGTDRKEAERAFHSLQATRDDEVTKDVSSRMTLARLIDMYLHHKRDKVKPVTWGNYQQFLQYFLDYVGDIRMAQLKPYHLTRWLDDKPEWNSSTKHIATTTVKLVSRWGHSQGFTDSDAFSAIKRPPMLRRRGLTLDELTQFFLGVRTTGVQQYIDLAMETGCRPSELLTLTAAQLNEQCTLAEVCGKRGKRTIALSKKASVLLQGLRQLWPEGPLLRNTLGKGWDIQALQSAFCRISKRAGIKVQPYQLRGLFSSLALRRGIDSLVVSKMLGHSSTRMLERHYATIDADQLAEAFEIATRTAEPVAAVDVPAQTTDILPLVTPADTPPHPARGNGRRRA